MFNDYISLLKKVDDFIAGMRKKYPNEFSCGPGCSKCCVGGINLWHVEFDRIHNHVAQNKTSYPIVRTPKSACHMLNNRNSCKIYDIRPLVCRVWGTPLYYNEQDMDITCCDLNFAHEIKIEDLELNEFLNMQLVNKTLAAINHVYCKAKMLDPKERKSLTFITGEGSEL